MLGNVLQQFSECRLRRARQDGGRNTGKDASAESL